MNTATLDFPPIDAAMAPPPAGAAVVVQPAGTALEERAPMSIKEAAIAFIRGHESAIVALAARYKDVALDLSTPKAFEAGKATRTEVREQGRLLLQRERDKAKDALNDAKAIVVEEAQRLIDIIEPVEKQLQAQIEARQKVMDDEKEARKEAARVEAVRVAAHQANLARFAEYVQQARGKSSADLAKAINFINGIDVGPGWQEFQKEAEAAKADTLLRFQELFDAACQAEADAAELARRREQEERMQMALQQIQGIQQQVVIAQIGRAGVRAGGTLKCIRDTLAETEAWVIDEENFGMLVPAAQVAKDGAIVQIRALLERAEAQQRQHEEDEARQREQEAAALEAARLAELEAGAPKAGDAAPITQNAQEEGSLPVDAPAPGDAPVLNASNAPEAAGAPSGDEGTAAPAEVRAAAPAQTPDAGPLETGEADALEPAAPAPEAATIKLGALCAEIGDGFKVTEAFVASLGILPTARDKGAVLYTPAQRRQILLALAERIRRML